MCKNETTRRTQARSSSKPGELRRMQTASKREMNRARISPGLKAEAEIILDQIGPRSSDAVRMFYKQITLRNGLPFEARMPNATTRVALRHAD